MLQRSPSCPAGGRGHLERPWRMRFQGERATWTRLKAPQPAASSKPPALGEAAMSSLQPSPWASGTQAWGWPQLILCGAEWSSQLTEPWQIINYCCFKPLGIFLGGGSCSYTRKDKRCIQILNKEFRVGDSLRCDIFYIMFSALKFKNRNNYILSPF